MNEELDIPEGMQCSYDGAVFVCSKGSDTLKRNVNLPSINLEIKGKKIILGSEKGNKHDFKEIKSTIAHIKNLFRGLNNKFVFRLEACNVHFPMTIKLEGNVLVISNFLGEKVSRKARILPGVEVEIKGQKITLSSRDLEDAGTSATNIEKATKIKNRDRRIFQDGIFIVEKPEAKK